MCEAFPDMPAKSISDAYRTNDSFRDRFKGCLRVLHGQADRNWRISTVISALHIGQRSSRRLFAVPKETESTPKLNYGKGRPQVCFHYLLVRTLTQFLTFLRLVLILRVAVFLDLMFGFLVC